MQPVVRALAVLKALAPASEGLSLAALAEDLEVPQGSMHRLLAVLERERFVTRSPSNRRYFLGSAARQLAEENSRGHALLVPAHPVLVEAAARSGETVFLTELVGDRAVCVSLAESSHPLRMFVSVGQEMPLHAAASARTLLAHLDPEQARRLLLGRVLTAYTEDTVTDADALQETLALIRARGYDVCDDELDRGVWAVSVPVRASTGRVVASVTLSAPSYRVADPARRAEHRATMVEAARSMAAELGWVDPEEAPETAVDAPPPATPRSRAARSAPDRRTRSGGEDADVQPAPGATP